jgi:simple sugar transport system substrate-binding protein
MKKILLVIMMIAICISLMATLSLAGCKPKAAAETTAAETTAAEATVAETTAAETTEAVVAEEQLHFYFVTHAFPHPFFKIMENGAMDAAKLYGVNVTYEYTKEFSIEQQAQLLNEVLPLKPDGVVISVADPAALDAPARAIIDAGIPMMACNAFDPRPDNERIPYLVYFGADEYLAGRALAEAALKAKPNPVEVGIAAHFRGQSTLEERLRGVQDVLKEHNIVPDEVVEVTNDPTTINERTRAYFTSHPNIDIYFSMGHTPQVSITKDFFKETDRLGKVLMVTFDFDDETVDDIKSGVLLAVSDQQQYLQGYLPVEWLYLYKKYGFLPGSDFIPTGPFITTKDNIAIVETGIGTWR